FVAIAMVQAESLRPEGFPKILGQDFFLSGYRIFARYKSPRGRTLRGLRILRSDTNRRSMVFFGNLLTHYHYRHARVAITGDRQQLEIRLWTRRGEADLHVLVDLKHPAAALPEESPFADFREARLFAGPLPFTFDYEAATHS